MSLAGLPPFAVDLGWLFVKVGFALGFGMNIAALLALRLSQPK